MQAIAEHVALRNYAIAGVCAAFLLSLLIIFFHAAPADVMFAAALISLFEMSPIGVTKYGDKEKVKFISHFVTATPVFSIIWVIVALVLS